MKVHELRSKRAGLNRVSEIERFENLFRIILLK